MVWKYTPSYRIGWRVCLPAEGQKMIVNLKRKSTLLLVQQRKFIFVLLIPFFLSNQIFSQDTIRQRFAAPAGFTRVSVKPGSFAAWLNRLPLQPPGRPILDFRGKIFKHPPIPPWRR